MVYVQSHLSKLDLILEGMEGINLGGLDQISLLNRVDTKAYFSIEKLINLFESIQEDYFVLEVAGTRRSFYKSLYYDTLKHDFYLKHHNQKGNRYKIRYRKYVESNLSFFEVKFKNNKGRTIKKRVKVSEIEKSLGKQALELLDTYPSLSSVDLHPSLWVYFKRITLANKELTERVTIDTELNFVKDQSSASYHNLIIVEIKQNSFDKNSKILKTLKDLGVSPNKISKYCVGQISCDANLKRNRFKAKIKNLNKIQYGIS